MRTLGDRFDKAKAVHIAHTMEPSGVRRTSKPQNCCWKARTTLLPIKKLFTQRQADWASDLLCSAVARGKKKKEKK
jgi:hypothetical protein